MPSTRRVSAAKTSGLSSPYGSCREDRLSLPDYSNAAYDHPSLICCVQQSNPSIQVILKVSMVWLAGWFGERPSCWTRILWSSSQAEHPGSEK